jgi:hypothetical protein
MSKQASQTQAVATAGAAQAPSVLDDLTLDELQADAGHGLQNVTSADVQMPLLKVLQSNSPQCDRTKNEYIEGARAGEFFNNVTNERFDGDKGIVVVPAFFEKCYIEWQANRGGFVTSHAASTPLKNQTQPKPDKQGKLMPTLPNGNVLSETNNHFGLVIKEDGSFEPVVLPMASSLLKSSRVWNSLMKRVVKQNSKGEPFTPASYYMTYKLTTGVKTKDNNSWYVINVEPAGPTPTRALYEKAKAFEQAVSAGKVKVKMDADMQAHSETTVSEAEDDSIPF